jgi:hypothetical protein
MDHDEKETLEQLGKSLGLDLSSDKFKFNEADAGITMSRRQLFEKYLEEYNKIDTTTFENTKLDIDMEFDSMQTKLFQFTKLLYYFGKETKMFDEGMTKKKFYTGVFTLGLMGHMGLSHYMMHSAENELARIKEIQANPDKYRKQLEQMISGEVPNDDD